MNTAAPPLTGLRARKRTATMHRIQTEALDLFDARGFDAVTIEEIAVAAVVSPSSIYRYFGTKEGIVIHDEHDAPLLAEVRALLGTMDPWTAAATAIAHSGMAALGRDDLMIRRTRYYVEEPAVRRAVFQELDAYASQLADAIVASPVAPQRDPAQARAIAGSILFGLWLAAEEWFRAGCREDLADTVTRALAAISPVSLPAPGVNTTAPSPESGDSQIQRESGAR